jgi:phosphohistidine phosphatase
MKTVLLLRHAKSDWGDPSLADFDRPLAKRGLKDAPRMGRVLADFNHVPDRILSSPARRARQTTELVAEACGYQKSIEWHEPFYGGTSQDLIEALKRLPDAVDYALLVGHNPTMEETVVDLLTNSQSEWNDELAVKMPTAALACLNLSITDWDDLEPGDAILRWFVIPKLIKALQ